MAVSVRYPRRILRRVLGWAMYNVQASHLVECALRMAYILRGDAPDELVFHADRGTQFTSRQLWQVCQELGIAQSVGRTGVCFDNAGPESFGQRLRPNFMSGRNGQAAMKLERLWRDGLRSSTTGTQPPGWSAPSTSNHG